MAAAAAPKLSSMASRVASLLRSAKPAVARLADSVPRDVVDDIFGCALKKQTGVSLKYMLDFGANPIERQLILSAQFLHNELPVSDGGFVCLIACFHSFMRLSVALMCPFLTCLPTFQALRSACFHCLLRGSQHCQRGAGAGAASAPGGGA